MPFTRFIFIPAFIGPNSIVPPKRSVEPIPVVWNKGQLANAERSCTHCAVRETCIWNVPSGNYYIQGALLRRGRRPHSPEQPLFQITNLAGARRKPVAVARPAPLELPAPRLF